jgi:hypothetical protein
MIKWTGAVLLAVTAVVITVIVRACVVMMRQLGAALGIAALVAILDGATAASPLSAFTRAWGFTALAGLSASLLWLLLAPGLRESVPLTLDREVQVAHD